ncbi:hypothetical protein N7486_007301 [Penicillium sp. IBT 16267x]|nr:hypothetical protein N7486_007301 [Penicillium sp. IBT 16267x]
MSPPPQIVCANWSPGNASCKKIAILACSHCQLVVYCEKDCQKSHWRHHMLACYDTLNGESWNPSWVEESRAPVFKESGTEEHFDFPYIWSHTAAHDILNLQANEGKNFKEGLRLLFAASGDLGSVFTTITNLPQNYNGSIELTINDHNFNIVARNIIILLIGLVVQDVDQAIDCIIHIWYSIMIRTSDILVLQKHIAPMFATVQKEIKDLPKNGFLEKTWSFGSCSLKVGLCHEAWNKLSNFVTGPAGLTEGKASQLYRDTNSPPWRIDYVHRRMVVMSPARRLTFNKWLADGLLLPFGHPRHEFTEPNPTLWSTADAWPAQAEFEPVQGWSPQVVDGTCIGNAQNDIYGKLFFHLRWLLSNSLSRMSTLNNSFHILNISPLDLSNHLKGTVFDRIDTSFLADSHWLGMKGTIRDFAHLLPPKQAKPHATMICPLENIPFAVNERNQALAIPPKDSPGHKRLCRFAPLALSHLTGDDNDPKMIKLLTARVLVACYEPVFKLFAEKKSFRWHGLINGVEIKQNNTIVDKWPNGLKIPFGEQGDEHEFNLLMGENHFRTEQRGVFSTRANLWAMLDIFLWQGGHPKREIVKEGRA